MAPPGRFARKRIIEDASSDPSRFLKTYFAERGIPESPEEDAPLLRDCVLRANGAREQFKGWRDGDDDDGRPALDLTPGEKYKRRLVNNRRSADASRVHSAVLRREHTHALRTTVAERDRMAEEVKEMKAMIAEMRAERERMIAAARARKIRRRAADACVDAGLAVGSVSAHDGSSEDGDKAGDCYTSAVAAGADADDILVPVPTVEASSASVINSAAQAIVSIGEASLDVNEVSVSDFSSEARTEKLGDVPVLPVSPSSLSELCSLQGAGASQASQDPLLALPAFSPPAPFIAPVAPLCIVGYINSQLSPGIAGCLEPSPASAPRTDDYNDTHQLSSQLFALSQGPASQPLPSQS